MYSGYDENEEWFQLFQIGFGGIPGRPVGDGPDGHSLWPGFTNVPNEFVEAYFPLRIETYETITDSGGAGNIAAVMVSGLATVCWPMVKSRSTTIAG